MIRSYLTREVIRIKKITPDFRGKHKLSKAIETALGSNIALKLPEGISLITRLSSQMDTSFLEEGGHSLIREEIYKLKPGDTFLDIGANIGYFSLLATKQMDSNGLAIAVEPSAREYAILLKNIKLNHFEKNIVSINCAASDQTSICKFNVENHTGTNKITDLTVNPDATTLTISLPLKQVIPSSVQSISLAKIDVEGYEVFALKGLLSRPRSVEVSRIVIEFSPLLLKDHKQSVDDIYGLLKSHNYQSVAKAVHGNGQWDEVFALTTNR